MSTFEFAHEADGSEYYRMETQVHPETSDALRTVVALEGVNVTEAFRRVIGSYKGYVDLGGETGLVFQQRSGRLEAIEPQSPIIDEDTPMNRLGININLAAMNFVSPYDRRDPVFGMPKLIGAAVNYYGKLNEAQLLGSKIFCIAPNLAIKEWTPNKDFLA